MSIASAIQAKQQQVADAYTAISNKGGTLPATQDLANMDDAINSITELKGETKTVTPSTSQQVITPSSGKNGITQVTVNAVTSAIDQDIIPSNIKSGVEILGITGNYAGQGATIDSLNVTPSTSAQTITASGGVDGYSPVNVSAVTASIDSNIQPQYIRNGVTILSVVGTYGEPIITSKFACSNDTTWYINSSSELYGCGRSNYGQQGSGNTSNVTTFTKRADNVVFVACSNDTTWYINSSSELYGCGRSNYGQQGSGDTSNVTTFTKRADNVVFVACSNDTTWYINESGELYGCGYNNYGQQGSDDTSNVTTFTKRADNVVFVACSRFTTWYINESGELYGCGNGNYGQQGNGTSGSGTKVLSFTKRADNVVQVAASHCSTFYIDYSRNLYGCGNNADGKIGTGNTTNIDTFIKISTNVKKVIATARINGSADGTTWYINSSSELYGCGFNYYGQQGSGDTSNVTTFTKRADNVKQFACSAATTWYINENGELYGCGSNGSGTQGSGNISSVTTFTKRADNVVQVNCSESTTWYINNSNEVYGCGYNNYGQQGNGTSGSLTNVLTFTKRN